jgi:transposase InsO family protein
MDEQQREKVALFRFSVIGALVSGELAYGDLQRLLREMGQRHYSIPFSNRTRISPETIEEWLYAYRRNGFEALKPKPRSDKGTMRTMRQELAAALLAAKAHPKRGLKTTLKDLLAQGIMKPNELPLSNGYRFLKKHLPRRPASKTGDEKRRFAHRYPNDCWQSDALHGPYLKVDDCAKARKTYLIAFLDDATRLIVAARFFFSEAAVNIKNLLRHAILTYGIPNKLYLDNGKNFCSHDLQVACATMRTALIHTTPYYPEGKGNRTVFSVPFVQAFSPLFPASPHWTISTKHSAPGCTTTITALRIQPLAAMLPWIRFCASLKTASAAFPLISIPPNCSAPRKTASSPKTAPSASTTYSTKPRSTLSAVPSWRSTTKTIRPIQ